MFYLALVALSLGFAAFFDFGGADGSDDEDSGDGDPPLLSGEDPLPTTGQDPIDDDPGGGILAFAQPPPRIIGTFDDDLIDLRGQEGAYRVNLHEGADRLYLGEDGSTAYGGTGPDIVAGGAGDDHVFLGDGRDQFDERRAFPTGDDLVRGGRGADKLVSRAGADTLWGDLGADDLYALDDPGQPAVGDRVHGGFGKDRLWLDGGDVGFGGGDPDQFTLLSDSGVAAAPPVIGDLTPSEDVLIIDLPTGQTASHGDLGFTGTDGTRITLTVQGQPVAVLDNVWFVDLTPEVVSIR